MPPTVSCEPTASETDEYGLDKVFAFFTTSPSWDVSSACRGCMRDTTRIAVPKTVEFQASLLPQSVVPLFEPPSVIDNYTVLVSSNMSENSASSAQASKASTSLPLTEQVSNDQIASSDNSGELQELGVDFVDQNVLERELMAKVVE